MNAKISVPLMLLASTLLAQDYPGATWNLADANNYGVASRKASDIRWIVIHTTEDAAGSDCSVSQNWFKNPASGVSAHYVICRDGTVVQMVRDKDIAYHAGNFGYNEQSIGIEHERHDISNWTEAQFQASAQLVRWLLSRYNVQGIFPSGIAAADPNNGSGIIGHNQVPDPINPGLGGGMHHRIDPVNWDWARYQALFPTSNFMLTAERAVRVTVPTRESYQYQVSSSADLTNWLPATDLVTACSSNETFSFPATNSNTFYRAQEWPPDLSKRIVGLSNVFLDTARLSSRSNQMTIEGMRVQSRDYNFNDYLTAIYDLDLCKQTFALQGFDVVTNVGPTCGVAPVFFLKDATNSLVMTYYNTNQLLENVTYPGTTTGITFTVVMNVGNALALVTSNASANYKIVVTGPTGDRPYDRVISAGSTQFSGPINAFKPGPYSIRLEPFNTETVSLSLRFRNLNRRPTTTVVSGGTIAAALQDYWWDYAKFKITASAGQTLRLAATPGGNQTVIVCNSLGIVVGGYTGGGPGISLIFPISRTDNYFILYTHSDGSAYSYSTTVTLTP